jgi:hypothetical protein
MPNGLVVFVIEIYLMAAELYMVDFVKLQGHYDDFYQLYKEISEACDNLVSVVERRFTIA